eukprot:SM000139S00114  [mRNA]  locus=s139:89372:90117:+ [translate_table: standard]
MTRNATRIKVINDFTFLCCLDNVNQSKLKRYIKDSKVVHKVSTYEQQQHPQHLPTGEDSDGRVLCQAAGPEAEDPRYEFVMLSAAKHVEEFSYLQEVRYSSFRIIEMDCSQALHNHDHLQGYFCGDIVPASYILPLAAPRNPTGKGLEFQPQIALFSDHDRGAGTLMCDICTLAHDKVVCLFPSFAYESEVHDTWHASSMMKWMNRRKRYIENHVA